MPLSESVFLRSTKAKNMMKHLIVPVECQLQQGLDPVPPLHKLDTILCGRRNGFSKPSSDFRGKPCLTLLASGSLKQVSYSLCLGYRSGKNVLSGLFKSVGAWILLCLL